MHHPSFLLAELYTEASLSRVGRSALPRAPVRRGDTLRSRLGRRARGG
jgi:hypothetical protein